MVSAFFTFVATFAFTLFYTSVFYHRGLTHRAVKLGRRTLKFVLWTGAWVTGVDPKAWVCMHRIHHTFSDTKLDPHSPQNGPLWKILWMALLSYGKTMDGLREGDPFYTDRVKDLKFPIHWLYRNHLWYLPHILNITLGLGVGAFLGEWGIGLGYILGMESHPLQGWAVNALGHSHGYRNFKTNDRSTNNLAVAWFVMGEGLQNNHHHSPRSASFSRKWWEPDFGYTLCLISEFFGLLKIYRKKAPVSKSAKLKQAA